MPSVTKRKGPRGTRYRVRIRLQGNSYASKTFDRKTDADDWAQQVEADLKRKREVPEIHADKTKARRTLADLIELYLQDGIPESCTDAYGPHLTWWEKKIGARRLTDIDPPLIASLREQIAAQTGNTGKRRGPSTVNRYLNSLSAVFTFGQQEEVAWVDHNPVRAVRKRREPKGRIRFLSRPVDEPDSELVRLMAACTKSKSPILKDLVVVAILTGMREGEILALRRHYVRLPEAGITLPPEITKGDESRFVPLVGEALEIITKRVQSGRDFLFGAAGRRNAHAGVPLFPRTAWNTALRRAKIAHFRFHDLRHTHSSYLAMKGASIRELMEALGHKTPDMAVRYSHLTSRHMSEVASRLLEIEGIR